jgi:DNA replication protein DnaC
MTSTTKALGSLLRALRLPTFAEMHEELAGRAEREGWTFAAYLQALAEQELAARDGRRIERNLKASSLPLGKSLATLNQERLPANVRRLLASLCTGDFLKRAINVLAFGLPGRGKTHVCAALGQELVRRGFRVLFVSTYQLVQRLLVARRELDLERALVRLDAFDAVILDDIGYIQQDRDEMEVLFTFLAQRYERRSVIVTSNLVFSQWDRIFKDPMTTAAAIDRLVHHSIILEMTGSSVRKEEAMESNAQLPSDALPEEPAGP